MTASKKVKNEIGHNFKFPSDDELKEMRDYLSSDEVIGSSVLPRNANPTDQMKYALCKIIVQYHLGSGLSQKDLAAKLEIDPPEMSRILHYKFERYTIDRLLGYVTLLNPKVRFILSAA